MRHVDDGTLNAWLDGALHPGDAAAVAVHLEHCEACRSRLAEAEHWRRGADKLLASSAPGDVVPPPFQHVLERAAVYPPAGLRTFAPFQPGQPLRALPAWATVAWAATILLALALGYYAGEVYRPASQAREESGRLQTSAAAPAATRQATPAASGAPGAPATKMPAPPAVIPSDIPAPLAGLTHQYAGPIVRESPAPAPGRERPLPEARERLAAREADATATPPAAGAPASAPIAPAAAAPTALLRAPDAFVKSFVQPSNALDVAGRESTLTTMKVQALTAAGAVAATPWRPARPSDVVLKGADSALARRGAELRGAVPAMARNVEAAPTFTPYTVRPELLNREEVRLALVRFYPPLEKAAAVEGTTLLWVLIDSAGTVKRTQIKASSGVPSLDEAAHKVAAIMRFSPALDRDRRVEVWVQLPIVFRTSP